MTSPKIMELIRRTNQNGETKLDLANTGIDVFPREILDLKNLKELSLADNYLKTIPDEISNLSNLELLSLRGNRLERFPEAITELPNLKILHLSDTGLTEFPLLLCKLDKLEHLYLTDNSLDQIPKAISNLQSLTRLSIQRNRLVSIPPDVGYLPNLEILLLDFNQLKEIPASIGRLKKLSRLSLCGNNLINLPAEIGELQDIKLLDLRENPLTGLPPELIIQGQAALLSYLREQIRGYVQQWNSKLLIVGEGGTGKTSLLRALSGKPFLLDVPTTHGLAIEKLEIFHPKEKVQMTLNCWDFGGQEIYHATHQFFLTDRSLFILVWNARLGYEQGKLYYWLDLIKAKAPNAPVILVATWVDERDAIYPYAELRQKYPQIVASYNVSSKTLQGINELRDEVRIQAANLPLMGERWPSRWLSAVTEIRDLPQKYVFQYELRQIFERYQIKTIDQNTLTNWLHELGDILFYGDDDRLSNIVILKPEWVSQYISKVLESENVIRSGGVFTRQQMEILWHDIPPSMREHFLGLMEKFDLSYQTLENRDISLVIERLPYDPPNYLAEWDELAEKPEITMNFHLNTMPPGIPTWFIARSHRFTTYKHWRMGALFKYSDSSEMLGLVRAMPHERFVQLQVRGNIPHNFFAILRDGLELTFSRYPGLDIKRTVPCPGHGNKKCDFEFSYDSLQKAMEKQPPVLDVQCQESFDLVSVTTLLFGLSWGTRDIILRKLEEIDASATKQFDELAKLLQREFIKNFRIAQSQLDAFCPNVFTFRPVSSSNWNKLLWGEKVELQLYCQAPGCWHPTINSGKYTITYPIEFFRQIYPYLKELVNILKYVQPFLGPWIGVSDPGYAEMIKNQIKYTDELIKILPEITNTQELIDDDATMHLIKRDTSKIEMSGMSLRIIRDLLDELDPKHIWGGLRRVITPEGHILWLCEYHAKEYLL